VSPQLSFIIVNWNGGELLKRCIESIVRNPPGVPFDIMVVDNASTDDSPAWLRSTELSDSLAGVELKLVANDTNPGFGRANNQAFALTKAPMLFLLNPDAELTQGACDTLIKTLSSGERIGACGPRIINPDGSLQISVWRNPPTAWATLLSGLKLARLLPKRIRGELLLAEYWDHDRRRDVTMLGGAAILLRREVIDQVGGFDERFHMYGEDNEWCLRISRSGWTLMFEPDAVVIHRGAHGSTQRWTNLEKLRVQTEAYLRFLNLALPRHKVIANLLASAGMLSLQRVFNRLRRRRRDDVETVLNLHRQALKRALSNQRI
jgi:GT2 family glycosyltransferase